MNITIESTKKFDPRKAEASLKHTYTIEADWNLSLPEEEQVKVVCRHFKSGEANSFLITKRDESGENINSFDIRGIFRKKVLEIENLTINGLELKTPDDVLNYPANQYTSDIVNDLATHLILSSRLTEDEEKN